MKPKIYLMTCLLVTMLFSITAHAQLSGNYTINSAVSTGGANFQSFQAFHSALASGISGPVTVNVVAGSGPYYINAMFTPVSGASSTNRITINGNGESVENSNTGISWVIQMYGADYFTFRNLKVKCTSNLNYARCFWFRNQADNNII